MASDDGAVPDFEALYGGRPMTARMAAGLWFVADATHGSHVDGASDAWFVDLPRIAQVYADASFVAAFGERFGIIADRIATGLAVLTDIATCTADEVALHLVMARVEELVQEGGLGVGWMDRISRRSGDDNFYGVKDELFHDLDVLHLYDASADGSEDPESDVAQMEGFANLHPQDWFKPFDE